ncbi:MAG: MlaD family protein [Dissulfurispiraceae bacterium]|jgi:ABC-type transporter Mla subunit MlaD
MKEEIKAGIIVVLSLVILTGFIILIGGSQLFEKLDIYYVKVKNAAGLENGASVKLGGVRAGKVIDVRAPEAAGNPVVITIGVKKGTPLYRGTKASITQVGFVGDIYLLLSVEKTTPELIRAGTEIPASDQVNFDMLMARLDEISGSANGLINDARKMLSKKNIENIGKLIEDTDHAISSGSSSLDKLAVSLNNTTGKLDRVLTEVEGLVKGNKGEITLLVKKAREDMEKAGDMIKAFEETAKSIDKTSRSADRAINLQSENIDALIISLTKTTEDLREVMQEIKNKPWSIIYKEGTKGEE